MAQNPTIKLPTERVEQLKQIARAHRLPSIADAVGHLIRAEIQRGTIPDTIPGIEVASLDGENIGIDFGDDPVLFEASVAAELADELTLASNGGKMNLSDDGQYAVMRQGNAVILAVPVDGARKTLSRDVARDLARVIRAAIAANHPL